ncbi:hypothetical protein PV729_04335 [Streptomyces europaeiscabiei]|uniref:Uncharacterized protein n=1 Tax=Streptomyces europaeiscabiei TaxID=146819 RepID=A0ABU4N9T1_9ACTN|nr:hypothetical protein [Streptomyces europaeiscabiei]MDX3551006.1 hypothetical protein [Streptomyces europaeiscabiei]MDX3698434.1 hypothetical protein [Streptomyces europaeiscabiei]
MALYEVKRTDTVQPGEFDNALVVAGGTALARSLVKHLLPDRKGVKVEAHKVDIVHSAGLLVAYFDETQPHVSDFTD